MVKSEKDKGIDGYGEAGGVCIVKQIQKVQIIKGLLQFVLAPPAGYIPRHYRGTPLKRDAAAVTLVIYSMADTNGLQLRVPSSEGYGEAGGYVS